MLILAVLGWDDVNPTHLECNTDFNEGRNNAVIKGHFKPIVWDVGGGRWLNTQENSIAQHCLTPQFLFLDVTDSFRRVVWNMFLIRFKLSTCAILIFTNKKKNKTNKTYKLYYIWIVGTPRSHFVSFQLDVMTRLISMLLCIYNWPSSVCIICDISFVCFWQIVRDDGLAEISIKISFVMAVSSLCAFLPCRQCLYIWMSNLMDTHQQSFNCPIEISASIRFHPHGKTLSFIC